MHEILKVSKSLNQLLNNLFVETDRILRIESTRDKRSITTTIKIADIETKELVDCDATVNFIDEIFVKSLFLKSLLIVVSKIEDVNDNIISLEKKNVYFKIDIRVQNQKMQYYLFRAMLMKDEQIILSMLWLQIVNSIVNWKLRILKMSRNIQVLEIDDFMNKIENETIYIYYTDEFSKSNISKAYKKFFDIFFENVNIRLSSHRENLNHFIDLQENAASIFEFLYNLSKTKLKILKEYIDTNLKLEFITRFNFSIDALILFVKKKDESLKLCVDYRHLNSITIRNRYSISLISNILERLKKIKIFIKIDLRNVYNLIRIKKNHEWLTAFRTRYEFYQYNVMSFELTNASAIFQFYIDRVLFNLIDVIVVVYLNDILIYSENEEDHEKHVKKILQVLKNHELLNKSKKCVFSTKTIEFLRFIISSEEIFMNFNRVAIIVNWSVLTSIKKIQFFLKFCNFYRRFIRNYSKIALTMIELTKRTTRFEWNSATQTSFESLKNVFKRTSLLIQFDLKKHSILMTDASNRVIADILLQKQNDTHFHSIAFHSRKLTSTKQNYETSDQELLVIVNSFKIWRHYLEETQHKVVILTNHTI